MDERSWKVGELAEGTGLTVRALHHFDAVGLLRPSARSAVGHRVYTAADVRRLYRILALRQLGMPLATIARSLDGGVGDLGSAVAEHRLHTQRHIEHLRVLHTRLTALLTAIEQAAEPSVDQLIEAMEALVQASPFTPDQLARARQRHAEAEFADRLTDWQRRAGAIADVFQTHVDRGTDPADPAVQALAGQWSAVIRDMADGDPTMISAIYAKIDGKGAEAATRGALTTPVWEYLKRAFAVGFTQHT